MQRCHMGLKYRWLGLWHLDSKIPTDGISKVVRQDLRRNKRIEVARYIQS